MYSCAQFLIFIFASIGSLCLLRDPCTKQGDVGKQPFLNCILKFNRKPSGIGANLEQIVLVIFQL